jgi:hypothetical protein
LFFFWDRVSWIICLDWLWILILLIATSWVARITGANHLAWVAVTSYLSSAHPFILCGQVQVFTSTCPSWSPHCLSPLYSYGTYHHSAIGIVIIPTEGYALHTCSPEGKEKVGYVFLLTAKISHIFSLH